MTWISSEPRSPLLAGMRVQTGHCDARASDSPADQEVRKKPPTRTISAGLRSPGNTRERNMRRDESHGDLAASQAHGKIGDAASFGEKFGLTRKRKSGFDASLFLETGPVTTA